MTCFLAAVLSLPMIVASAAEPDPVMFLRQGLDQESADHIVGPIYKATGFGNTFLIATEEGNVIIDTSLPSSASHHHKLLRAVDSKPIDYLILTHGHGDHTGGVDLWRSPKTRVVAHKNSVEFLHYQERLRPFFGLRNAAQFGLPLLPFARSPKGNFGATIPANVLFEETHVIELGKLRLVLMHAPAETYDAIIVWIPELKAVFTGDLYYESFPNLYTLRGTKPRYALDYLASINKVLALEAAYLIPSHGEPVVGERAVQSALEKYRNAIQYVHDGVVAQLNAGATVNEAMKAVVLPEALAIGEGYGRVDWSVRGIYEGYAGWFNANPVSMYPVSSADAYRELVLLAGGPDGIVQRAQTLLKDGKITLALKLTDALLAHDPGYGPAQELRIAGFRELLKTAGNLNEVGWLRYGIREAEAVLGQQQGQNE